MDYYDLLNIKTQELFVEFKSMDADDIAKALFDEGFRMPSPLPGQSVDINHTCVTAQLIKRRTGNLVACGTTSFLFENDSNIYYLPKNVVEFTQNCFKGKYHGLHEN